MNSLFHVVAERRVNGLVLPDAGQAGKRRRHNDHTEMVVGAGGVDHLDLSFGKRNRELGSDFFSGDHHIAMESGHGRSAIAI